MEVEEKPPIEAVLEHYGADVVPDGHGWRAMRCPFHDDRNASASVNVEEGVFTCHACGTGGDSLSVIGLVEGVPFLLAVAYAKANLEWEQPEAPSGRTRNKARRRVGRRWRPPGRRGR